MRTWTGDLLNTRATASWAFLIAASCVLPLLHCANADHTSSFDGDAGPPDAGPPGETGGFTNVDPPSPPDDVGCAEATKQIYVLATDLALYRFYPDKLQFVRVGQVACPTVAGTFSMAIDRRGTAW